LPRKPQTYETAKPNESLFATSQPTL